MLLCDKKLIGESETLIGKAKTIALDANAVYTELYMRHMLFESDL
jgi:hypothetical protein